MQRHSHLGLRAFLAPLVWVVVGVVCAGAVGWLYPFVQPADPKVLTQSGGLAAWLVVWALFGALTSVFALCFRFGVIFDYFNSGQAGIVACAGFGLLVGLVIGGLTSGLLSLSPGWFGGIVGGLTGLIVFFMVGSCFQSENRRSQFLMGVLFYLTVVLTALLGLFLLKSGWVPIDALRGAVGGAGAGIVVGYFSGAAINFLTDSPRGMNVALGACALAGLAAGTFFGSTDLDGMNALVHAALRGGVFGGLAGIVTAVVIGLVGGTFCSGRKASGTIGGSLGAAFHLGSPGVPKMVEAWTGRFAANVGIYPGGCLGLWTGSVIGALGFLGKSWGPVGMLTAATVAGGLLTLVFFGIRVVLQGSATPRSAPGMVRVALLGAALGAGAAGAGAWFGTGADSRGYWMLGLAVAGALIGAKCWEFVGGEVVSAPLLAPLSGIPEQVVPNTENP